MAGKRTSRDHDHDRGRGPGHERGRGQASGREIARRVLTRVFREGSYLALALDAEFDRAELPERERKLATELCYGVCRHLSRLDRAIRGATARGKIKVKAPVRTALRVGAYQLLFLDRVPAHAAVDDAVGAARRAAGAQVAAFVNSVLRRLSETGEPAFAEPDESTRSVLTHACELHSTPEWMARRLFAAHPDRHEFLAAIEALNRRAPLCVRVNRERVTTDELAGLLAEEKPACAIERTPYLADALVLDRFGDPARSPAFVRGLFTVQDVGAQLICHFATAPSAHGSAPPVARVLDACAGVGGKCTHLAELLGRDTSTIIEAVDISAAKLERLVQAARRLGVAERVRTAVADLARPSDTLGESDHDLVLLDAPCTGLGVLRRHPEAKWRVHESDVAAMAATQRALLDQVSERVRPGGLLVYSVCTFTREEGPEQIAAFLARHPAFTLDPPAISSESGIPWSELESGDTTHGPAQIATWPHRHDADAFFAARLRRRVG